MNQPQRAEPKPDHTGNSPVIVKTDLRTAESLETLITETDRLIRAENKLKAPLWFIKENRR